MAVAQPRERVRVGLVAACFALGTAFLVGALWVESRWGWHGVAPSIFVNVGTGFLVAAAFFLLQRKFIAVVRQATAAAASSAAAEVVQDLEERTARIETRISDLTEATQERLRSEAHRQDETVRGLDLVSFDSVTKALQTAATLRALDGDIAVVQASRELRGLWLRFRWGVEMQQSGMYADRRRGEPMLTINAEVASRWIELEWRPDEPAPDVAARLVRALQSGGVWTGDAMLDWSFALENLQRTLQVAIASRRRDAGAWHLVGALDRLIGQDLALTDEGIEDRVDGMLLSRDAFPQEQRLPGSSRLEFDPPRPGGTDPDEWRFAVELGVERFRYGRSIAALSYSSWRAVTDQDV